MTMVRVLKKSKKSLKLLKVIDDINKAMDDIYKDR